MSRTASTNRDYKNSRITFEEESLLDEFDFLFEFFHISEKASNPKGPPWPNEDRLMVAAFAAKGLNWAFDDSDRGFSEQTIGPLERGTTPFCPWKSLNAISKFGPSSKIGPLLSLTGMGTAMALEKDKLVGSLMFRKNGHLAMSSLKGEQSPFKFPKTKSIIQKWSDLQQEWQQFIIRSNKCIYITTYAVCYYFQSDDSLIQLMEGYKWIHFLDFYSRLGLDELSMGPNLLTGFITTLVAWPVTRDSQIISFPNVSNVQWNPY